MVLEHPPNIVSAETHNANPPKMRDADMIFLFWAHCRARLNGFTGMTSGHPLETGCLPQADIVLDQLHALDLAGDIAGPHHFAVGRDEAAQLHRSLEGFDVDLG